MKIEQTGTEAVIVIPAFEPTENFYYCYDGNPRSVTSPGGGC